MARKYTIKTGGTLSGIAQLFYGDSSLFPLIAGANGITNPNVVAVGQVIAIPDLPQHWEPFTTFGEFDDNGESIGRFKFPNKVPPGKRLVIETVTGCYYGDGAVLGPAVLSVEQSDDRLANHSFPWVEGGAMSDLKQDRRFFGFNHYVRIYVNGPNSIQFDAFGGSFYGGDSSFSGRYTVSGFLEALPVG